MSRIRLAALVFLFLWGAGFGAAVHAMEAPTLIERNSGIHLDLSWEAVEGAEGYRLYYAPYPSQTPGDFLTLDLGNQTWFFIDLWDGAAYVAAVKAYTKEGESGFSNTVFFIIHSPNARDGDGDGYSMDDGDCDDMDPSLHPGVQDQVTASLWSDYLKAVADAETVEAGKISRDLTAIVEHDPNLHWKDGRVKVVTWLSYDTYDGKQGEEITTGEWYTWVTAAPELRRFFVLHPTSRRCGLLRMAQLLGMPPDTRHTRVAELWVRPADLFRPSPDPEITDHEAELNFPDMNPFIRIDDAYKDWFNDRKTLSYQGDTPFPWTRLGYAYDWNRHAGVFGLSEFVLKPHSTVVVGDVASTEDYAPLTGW